jgi:hypothetical protein
MWGNMAPYIGTGPTGQPAQPASTTVVTSTEKVGDISYEIAKHCADNVFTVTIFDSSFSEGRPVAALALNKDQLSGLKRVVDRALA